MFKFEEISKVFEGDFWTKSFMVLNGVNFEINSGDIVGFLGANGAGKTTAIKILLDFIRPTSGKVKFSEELGANNKEIFSKIGYLPERPYFYPDLSGREFLTYIGKLNSLSNKNIEKEILRWTNLLKVEFALDRKLRFYSKGMLQRLGFASALINDPQLLILDEPLAGLDPIGRKEFKDIMRTLASEKKTIFFSSHIIHDVEEVCKKVVILESGKIVYSGDIEALIKDNAVGNFKIQLMPGQILGSHNSFESKQVNESGYLVTENDLKSALRYIADNKLDLVKLERKTPSLEEIVYKVED